MNVTFLIAPDLESPRGACAVGHFPGVERAPYCRPSCLLSRFTKPVRKDTHLRSQINRLPGMQRCCCSGLSGFSGVLCGHWVVVSSAIFRQRRQRFEYVDCPVHLALEQSDGNERWPKHMQGVEDVQGIVARNIALEGEDAQAEDQ